MLHWTPSLKQKRALELDRTVVGRLRRKRLPEAVRAEECPIERRQGTRVTAFVGCCEQRRHMKVRSP